jgi:type IV secretion system protein VirB4
LLRLYTVRGLDFVGDTPETIGARMLQANQALKSLVGPWTLHAEMQRLRVQQYPQRPARVPVLGLIDQDRQRALLDPETGVWESRHFVALTWVPPRGQRQALPRFLRAADAFMAHLGVVLAALQPVEGDALLSLLHTTVSLAWHPVALPEAGTDLARYLCDSAWQGGRYPTWDATLGRQHVRILTLTGYPRKSWATMMQRLEALPLPLRWVTRWSGIEPHRQDTLLERTQEDWLGQEKKFGHRLEKGFTERAERLTNSDATRKLEELDFARQDVGAGFYGLGRFNTTVVTWAPATDAVERQADQVQHTLETLGFLVRREGDYGARTRMGTWCLQWLAPPYHSAAFLGAVPGNRTEGLARATLNTTLALSHLCPGLRTLWAGPEQDAHLQQPPWFLAHTETTSLARICHYVRDVGHSLLLGNTGAGKSTFVGFAMAQWLLYPTTQGTIFDVGRSARLLTLLCQGLWVDLGARTVPLQPLRDLDQPGELRWCLEWLYGICQRAGIAETHGLVQQYLKERLDDVAGLPKDQRTLSALLHACEAHSARVEPHAYTRRDIHGLAQADERLLTRLELQRAVQRALRPFCTGGEYGGVLDGVQAGLLDSVLVTFEHGGLVKTPRLLEAVSQYCFHLTERRFDTRKPMWIVAEEAPLLCLMPGAKEQIDAWLLTIRKAGGSLALVINSLQQAARLGTGVLSDENCPTRWYFPNVEALTPQTGQVYDLFGLTAEEKRLIATARPYSDIYYVCRERARRMIHLPLSRRILTLVARNADEDHELMDKLLERHGPAGFAAAWLHEHDEHEEGVCGSLD